MMNKNIFYLENEDYRDNISLLSLFLSCGYLHKFKIINSMNIPFDVRFEGVSVPHYIEDEFFFIDLTSVNYLLETTIIFYFPSASTEYKINVKCFEKVEKEHLYGVYLSKNKKQKIILAPNKSEVVINRLFPRVKTLIVDSFDFDYKSLELKLNIIKNVDEDGSLSIYYPQFKYDPILDNISGKLLVEKYSPDDSESIILLGKANADVLFRRSIDDDSLL